MSHGGTGVSYNKINGLAACVKALLRVEGLPPPALALPWSLSDAERSAEQAPASCLSPAFRQNRIPLLSDRLQALAARRYGRELAFRAVASDCTGRCEGERCAPSSHVAADPTFKADSGLRPAGATLSPGFCLPAAGRCRKSIVSGPAARGTGAARHLMRSSRRHRSAGRPWHSHRRLSGWMRRGRVSTVAARSSGRRLPRR
jgi:hypothetical protein